MRQIFIWTNADQFFRRIYVLLGLDGLNSRMKCPRESDCLAGMAILLYSVA